MELLKAQINSVSNIIGVHLTDDDFFLKFNDGSEGVEVYATKNKNHAPIYFYFSPKGCRIRLDRISHYQQFDAQEVLNNSKFKHSLNQLFSSSIEIQYYGKRGTMVKFFNSGKLIDKKLFADGWRGLFPTKILRYKPFN